MKVLFHSLGVLSIGLVAALGFAATTSSAGPARVAAPSSSPYYGRWTVDEERPVYTAKGKLYKTIDVGPCGRDFCGVSVNDANQCGATLFRFLAKHADGQTLLQGHGRWGAARTNVQIETWEQENDPEQRTIELYLGDGHDFGGRSESMPKFHAQYKRISPARCTAR